MRNIVEILGVRIDPLTCEQVLEQIKDFLDLNQKQQIATINAEFIMEAQKTERFKNILNDCRLNVADGSGPIWAAKYLSLKKVKSPTNFSAAKILGHGFIDLWRVVYSGASLIFYPPYYRTVIPERISGADLTVDLVRIAAEFNKRIFLLGGEYGEEKAAVNKLLKFFPDLSASSHPGMQVRKDGSYNSLENETVLAAINKFEPDILLVAFSHPKAQYWIDDNLKKLPAVNIAIGVGGTFNFLAGRIKRAPRIFRKLGIEWFWRLLIQPYRYQRILTATVRFIIKIYKSS